MTPRRVHRFTLPSPPWAGITVVSSYGGAVSGDDWLVEQLPSGVLRVAAIDGVSAHPDSPHTAPMDAAVWAAGVTRTSLRADVDPAAALLAAHHQLLDLTVTPSRARPQAAVAVADITPSPAGGLDVRAVAAADCRVAVPDGGRWATIAGGDHLTASARRHWQQLAAAHRGACGACADPRTRCDELLRIEGECLDDPGCHALPAVGRFATLRPQRGHATDVSSVTVSTDGIDPASYADDLLTAAARRLAAKPTRDVTTIVVTATAHGRPSLRP